ncbi:MAG: ribonuclease E/G, partial [Bdellovibrionota bacterium]
MSAEILINARPNQTRVAYIENGRLMDLKVDRRVSPTLVGSIYKGKVLRVLPGMQAAFVDIGLARAAFLYVGDIREDIVRNEEHFLETDSTDDNEEILESQPEEPPKTPIQDLLKPGQMLLVQIAKDPLGTKGARITTHISLPGRHIVYMPTLPHVGISRRIESEEERNRLKEIVDSLKPPGGLIVRTAGEGATNADIEADIEYLNRVWLEVESGYEKKKAIGVIHAELDVELRALRDLLNDKVDRVLIDDQKTFKKVQSFVSQFLPSYKSKVQLFRGDRPLFDLYDI